MMNDYGFDWGLNAKCFKYYDSKAFPHQQQHIFHLLKALYAHKLIGRLSKLNKAVSDNAKSKLCSSNFIIIK